MVKSSFYIVLFLTSFGFQSYKVSGQIGRYEIRESQRQTKNLRELCRQATAGKFIEFFDSHLREKNLLLSITRKLTDYESHLKTLKKNLAETEKSIDKRKFEEEKIRRRDDLATRIKVYTDYLKQNTELAKQTKVRLQGKDKEYARMHGEVKKVFSIVWKDSYPRRLDYLRSCPKYRFQCPLTDSDRKNLLKIFREGEIPKYCEKYSKIR